LACVEELSVACERSHACLFGECPAKTPMWCLQDVTWVLWLSALGSCDVCPPCFLSLSSMIICMFCTMFNSSPTPPSVMLRMFNIHLSIETQTPPPRSKVGICEKVLWDLDACLTRWCGGFLRICFCIFIEIEEQGEDLNQRRHRVGGLLESSPRKFLNLVDRKCYFHHLSYLFFA